MMRGLLHSFEPPTLEYLVGVPFPAALSATSALCSRMATDKLALFGLKWINNTRFRALIGPTFLMFADVLFCVWFCEPSTESIVLLRHLHWTTPLS